MQSRDCVSGPFLVLVYMFFNKFVKRVAFKVVVLTFYSGDWWLVCFVIESKAYPCPNLSFGFALQFLVQVIQAYWFSCKYTLKNIFISKSFRHAINLGSKWTKPI